MRAWLVHPEEQRLRAPVRILVWLAAVIGCAAGAAVLAAALAPGAILAALVAQSLAALVPTLLVARFVDRRPLAGIGLGRLRRLLGHGLVGAGLGAALIGLVAAVEHATGAAHYAPRPAEPPGLALSFGVLLLVALDEEVLFRGYLLTNLAEAWGGRSRLLGAALAALVSSLGFGAAHLLNPGAAAPPAARHRPRGRDARPALRPDRRARALGGPAPRLEPRAGLARHGGQRQRPARRARHTHAHAGRGALDRRCVRTRRWPPRPRRARRRSAGDGPPRLVPRRRRHGEPPRAASGLAGTAHLDRAAPAEAHPVQPIGIGPAQPDDQLEPGHASRGHPGTALEAPPKDPFGEG